VADGLIAETRFVFGVVLVSMLASGVIVVGSYWEQQRQAAEVRRLEEREAQRAELRRIIEDLDDLQQRMDQMNERLGAVEKQTVILRTEVDDLAVKTRTQHKIKRRRSS
jgi:uncharacterized protein YlxW (UPF0749 family)